jgi:type IV pilus assembly protein PilE
MKKPSRRGFSLMELMIALVIISVLLTLAAPSFQRATEQSQCNIAAANLQAIWAAQRFYWLENHQFDGSLADLQNLGLLDPSVAAASTPYVYSIQIIDNNTFTVTATRAGRTAWAGQLTIDQTGSLSGMIQATGQQSIAPSFQ